MKIERIDISSAKGRATISRAGTDITIKVTPLVGEPDSWVVLSSRPTIEPDCWGAASRLQNALDGYHGADGVVGEYLAVIKTFVD